MFEHNPWNPITVKTIKQCEFDQDAVLLSPKYAVELYQSAGFSEVKRRFTLFFPGLLKFLIPLESYLYFLPIGAQYYIIAKP